MVQREFDIVVYGAGGFTAQFIIQELSKSKHRIALAARDVRKMPKSALPTIECAICDIAALAARTKIIINCVGPYAYTGSAIVAACVASATSYIDISGETQFLRDTFAYNNESAVNAGVSIVQACGFDSVPADIGAMHLAQHFDSVAIDSTVYAWNCKLNKGTWASLLNSLRQKPAAGAPKHGMARPSKASLWRYNTPHRSYDVAFKGSDPYVVRRSSDYFSSHGSRSYTYTAYVSIGSLASLLLYLLFGMLLCLMARIPFCHSLMLAHPKLFSLGIVEEGGPSAAAISKAHFMLELSGKGLQNGSPSEKTLQITGPDPGYLTTSICAAQCALLLLEKEADIPKGVLTPAQAFHQTDIVGRLASKGINFHFLD